MSKEEIKKRIELIKNKTSLTLEDKKDLIYLNQLLKEEKNNEI